MTPAHPFHRKTRPLGAKLAALLISAGQLSAAHAACATYPLPGANIAGGEFNAGTQPGRYGYDYIYPTQTEVDVLKKLQLKLMRVPVLWERLQHTALGELDADEMARIDAVVNLATSNGMTITLDVHNYGGYRGTSLASSGSPAGALPDLWRRLALRYANRSNVTFGMMNEPNGIAADAWAAIARQTLAAIRATGARNIVIVPGTNWDGAQSWFSKAGGLSNAEALLPLASDLKVVFEVHQYFDSNFSGTSATCSGSTTALSALRSMGSWARSNSVKLMLGEFGVAQNADCLTALNAATAILESDKDVWYGWTYWAAGAWWGDYMFNLQSASGQAAQGGILKSRATTLNNATCTASATPGTAPVTSPPATTTPAPVPAPAPLPTPAPAPPPAATPAPAPAPKSPPGKLAVLKYFISKLVGEKKNDK